MTAKFVRHNNPLVVCPVDATCWILHEPFVFTWERNGRERVITAPENFVTDFTSIPWGLRLIAPRWGGYGWAAVIHDFLYWEQSIERREADEVFLDAMKDSEVPVWRTRLFYWAVRAFGGYAWRKNTRLKATDKCARIRTRPLPNPFEIRKWKQKYEETKRQHA
jgi:hypothetical protein